VALGDVQADLELSAIRRDLVRAAAKYLGLTEEEFSRCVGAQPELLRLVLEAEARVVGEAEALLLKTIRGDDVSMRALAAELYLDAATPTGRGAQ
jgi:hypothetical protein